MLVVTWVWLSPLWLPEFDYLLCGYLSLTISMLVVTWPWLYMFMLVVSWVWLSPLWLPERNSVSPCLSLREFDYLPCEYLNLTISLVVTSDWPICPCLWLTEFDHLPCGYLSLTLYVHACGYLSLTISLVVTWVWLSPLRLPEFDYLPCGYLSLIISFVVTWA